MRLNLASGQRPFQKPWTNIDIRPQCDVKGNPYKCDIVSDVKQLPMFKDNSVDVIVAHHIVEHFELSEVAGVAKEWQRILKPKGKLAVFVPNMRAIAKRWVNNEIDNFTYFVNSYGAYQGHITDVHRWGYDFEELRDRMSGWDGRQKHLEWSEVKEFNFNDFTKDQDFDKADCAWDWWVLSVLFIK